MNKWLLLWHSSYNEPDYRLLLTYLKAKEYTTHKNLFYIFHNMYAEALPYEFYCVDEFVDTLENHRQ